jgi:hypothetical protein
VLTQCLQWLDRRDSQVLEARRVCGVLALDGALGGAHECLLNTCVCHVLAATHSPLPHALTPFFTLHLSVVTPLPCPHQIRVPEPVVSFRETVL